MYIGFVMRWISSALFGVVVAFPTMAQSKSEPLVMKQSNPPDANSRYFPINVFGKNSDFSGWVARWYASQLRALGEPSLYKEGSSAESESKNETGDTYRITILPTWGNAVAIRVQKHGELYSLSARRLDGEAGYGPGKLVESKDIALGADDSKTLAGLIEKLNFFQMPTEEDVRGFDGDEWIIEGASQGKYHVIVRWCADSYDPGKRKLTAFLALCKFLVDKSTLSERPKNKGHKLI